MQNNDKCVKNVFFFQTKLAFDLQIIFYLFSADDINGLISGKLALKYVGKEIESIKAIAAASTKRSLAEFKKVNFIS